MWKAIDMYFLHFVVSTDEANHTTQLSNLDSSGLVMAVGLGHFPKTWHGLSIGRVHFNLISSSDSQKSSAITNGLSVTSSSLGKCGLSSGTVYTFTEMLVRYCQKLWPGSRKLQ